MRAAYSTPQPQTAGRWPGLSPFCPMQPNIYRVQPKIALDKYLVASGRMATIQATDPLFVAEGSNTPLSFVAIFKRMKTYLRAAGLDGRGFSIHSWRHTASRMRYAAGEDIRSLQRLLRHSSLATTDTYLRALAGTANSGARLLEDRF